MFKAIVHWGLPIVLSSGLLSLTHVSGLSVPQTTSGVSTPSSQLSPSRQVGVPLYPNSVETQATMTISSPFSMPLIFGASNQESAVWKVPVSYTQVENWYIRKMENQGYHLISRALSSLSHSESETFGLLFAKGQENVDQVGINIVPITPTLTEYQYISARLSVPVRPAASFIPSPSSVKSIDVTYKTWRYGTSAGDKILPMGKPHTRRVSGSAPTPPQRDVARRSSQPKVESVDSTAGCSTQGARVLSSAVHGCPRIFSARFAITSRDHVGEKTKRLLEMGA